MATLDDEVLKGKFYVVLLREGTKKNDKSLIYNKTIKSIYISYQGHDFMTFHGIRNIFIDTQYIIQTLSLNKERKIK